MATVSIAIGGLAFAQECTYELEPNDTPAQATRISGVGREVRVPGVGDVREVCFAGELSGDDRDQDAFYWDVGEEASERRYVVNLESFEGHLTSVRLFRIEFDADGVGVTSAEEIFYTETRNGRPTRSSEFMLAPGRYHVGISSSSGSGQYVGSFQPVSTPLWSSQQHRPGLEAAVRDGFAVHGAVAGEMVQQFALSEQDTRMAWGFELVVPLGHRLGFSLEGPGGEVFSVTTGADGFARRGGLKLTEGTYTARVSGDSPMAVLSLESQGVHAAGTEVEPNDSWSTATLFPLGSQMRGSADDDLDYFRIEVDEAAAARAWDLSIESGGNLREILLQSADGATIQRRTGARGVLRLHLDVGVYRLRLLGSDGLYGMSLTGVEPAQPGNEREPNDELAVATPLGSDGQMRGTLSAQDQDVFSLEVTGEAQLYRVQAVGAGVRRLQMLDTRGSTMAEMRGEGRLRLDDLLLMPGTHFFRVVGDEGEYALRGLSLGPAPPPPDPAAMPRSSEELAHAAPGRAEPDGVSSLAIPPPDGPPPPAGWLEVEPNDDQSRALRLRPGEVHVGRFSSSYDVDYYRFYLAEDEYVRIELVPAEGGDPLQMRLNQGSAHSHGIRGEAGPVVIESWLLAGDHSLRLTAPSVSYPDGYYQLRFTPLGRLVSPEAQEAADEAPAELLLAFDQEATPLAAFWHQGQLWHAEAALENLTDQRQVVRLKAAINHAAAEVVVEDTVELGPGERRMVPVRVRLPADLRDDLLLRVELLAETESSAVFASLEATPRCEAQAASPYAYWPMPETLLGRLNVLSHGAGARVIDTSDGNRTHGDTLLISGIVSGTNNIILGPGHSPTFELAGTDPHRLVGALLHPLSYQGRERQLKRFRIETSMDGVSFVTALEAELKAAAVEQAFEFPAPVTARYARLVFVDNHIGSAQGTAGTFKLLAETEAALGEIDLASPGLGGRMAWSEPLLRDRGDRMLSPELDAPDLDMRISSGVFRDELTFVIGFHHSRAAQITRLEWRDGPFDEEERASRFQQVDVEVSLVGPSGPWQPLAQWQLERDLNGRSILQLPSPTWARYLKLTAPRHDENQFYRPPDQLRVIEREAGEGYRSAVGEWGFWSRNAVYEALEDRSGGTSTSTSIETDDGDTMQQATPIASGQAVTGTVEVAVDVDWYRITVPQRENHLRLRLSGDPAVGYDHHLFDSSGLPLAHEIEEDGQGLVLTLFADPGDYYLRLEEPKRSVVVVWDTSGSVTPFRDFIYAALAGFAQNLDGEREAAQLLAFDSPPLWLLPIWSSDPERVQRAVTQFDRTPSNSTSETALREAAHALGGRTGTRAIVLITDAETPGVDYSVELWRALSEVRPRIFTMEVSSGGYDWTQDLMQTWAAVNGGHYESAFGTGDVDAGFARATCLLRRPKGYRVEVETGFVAPPGPGSLTVVSVGDGPAAAVQVIFDASGSMGRALPSGEQRITAAKRALEALIGQVLPDGTPFALRAFGHISPSSCESRLDVPLGTLDRAAALAAVSEIAPKLLSQTPLADALAAVVTDLADATGPRKVILITDGVESCGGDPAAAARTLRAAGPVDLAIVSLGLEPEALNVFEALAVDIGASYVDVGSFEDLAASIADALNPVVEFEVMDGTGEVVARGFVDGEPVSLVMGVYEVRVLAASVEVFEGVRVPGEQSVTVAVPR